MTVRDATRRESPDGNVLYIEEFREHLGVRTHTGEGSAAANAVKTRPELLLIGHGPWPQKPLKGMNVNLILLAYDTEGIETPNYKPNVRNRTSEHGFAWVRIADIAHIPPGEYGVNWRSFFRAEHWRNNDFRSFTNRFFCVGNPKGFWPRYGKSQFYYVSEGPAPFHRLFKELAGDSDGAVERVDAVEEVAKILKLTALVGGTPAAGGAGAKLGGKLTKQSANAGGKQPAWRGNANCLGESTVTNKGHGRSWAQIARANPTKL